jgi:hypothetical protein
MVIMQVTLTDIEQGFAALESGSKSREEIADFASEAMRADDAGLLHVEPSSEVARIWRAITYLSGVDIKEPSENYLHCIEDFIEFRASIGITSPQTPDSPRSTPRG